MKKIHLPLFFILFVLISLIEGVHFILDLRFLNFFIYGIPFFLFLLDWKKNYRIPKPLLFFTGVYLIFSFISTYFSHEVGTSLELLLRDLSFILILFYAHTHSLEIRRFLPQTIIWLSLFLIFISGILFLFPDGRLFIQGQRLNLLFNPSYLHKTIGDYLTLGMVASAYLLFIEKKDWCKYSLFIFTVIFLLSFSRTAYITIAIMLPLSLFLYRDRVKKIPPLLGTSLFFNIFLVLVLFLTYTSHTGISILNYLQYNLPKEFIINVRSLSNSHLPFWIAAIKGYVLSPIIGMGAGTFQYVSYRFTEYAFLPSNTSFNFLIDLFVERGAIAGISFILILLYIFFKSPKKDIVFLLFLTLLIGFMGYPTYGYTQIMMLFFIVMGILIPSTRGDVEIKNKWRISLALMPVLFINILFFHGLAIQAGNRQLAYALYPFDRTNLQSLITDSLAIPHNNTQTALYTTQYERFYGANALDLEFIGDTYKAMGGKYKLDAIRAYEQSFLWGRYSYGGNMIKRMRKLYNLKKEMLGSKEALRYVVVFLKQYRSLLDKDSKPIQEDIYTGLKKEYLQ